MKVILNSEAASKCRLKRKITEGKRGNLLSKNPKDDNVCFRIFF